MEYDYLQKLLESHITLRLLNKDHMPLILSFIHNVFVRPNHRTLPYSEVETFLNDYLHHLRRIYGEDKYPRSAAAYLEDWVESSFLHKYYIDLDDEPRLDLTPATEKAVQWLQSLEERQFVGTESRLLTVFELLRDIVRRTEQDPQARIEELQKQQLEIAAEIEKVQREGIGPYDPTQVKERFFQLEETARALLADFSQVEYNFRTLDRETREHIATSDKPKGELLDDIFGKQDVIWGSDQGRSFRAFWEFLMTPVRQAELADLLMKVFEVPEVKELNRDRFLEDIKFHLLDAGEKVYKMNNMLVEQLRTYLDSQAYLETRRIMEFIKSVEKGAIELKDHAPVQKALMQLADTKASIDLIMCRTLFTPPQKENFDTGRISEGEAGLEISALYRQSYIDEKELMANIGKALRLQSQVSLSRLTELFPIRKGLAEVVVYLHLAIKSDKAVIDDTHFETIRWTTAAGEIREWNLPQVIFVR